PDDDAARRDLRGRVAGQTIGHDSETTPPGSAAPHNEEADEDSGSGQHDEPAETREQPTERELTSRRILGAARGIRITRTGGIRPTRRVAGIRLRHGGLLRLGLVRRWVT